LGCGLEVAGASALTPDAFAFEQAIQGTEEKCAVSGGKLSLGMLAAMLTFDAGFIV